MPNAEEGSYRIFIGAFPTGPLAERIQAVRERIDPKTARITPPHVTLVGTYWRSLSEALQAGTGDERYEANEIALMEQFAGLAGQISSFNLILGGIRTFRQRVIYLDTQTSAELLHARQTLLPLLGQDSHPQWMPHLTLAMRLKGAAFAQTLAELEGSEWNLGRVETPIHALDLMLRAPHNPAWRSIAQLPLLTSASTG